MPWKVNQVVGIYSGFERGGARLEATVIIQVDRGVGSKCLERKESEDNFQERVSKIQILVIKIYKMTQESTFECQSH